MSRLEIPSLSPNSRNLDSSVYWECRALPQVTDGLAPRSEKGGFSRSPNKGMANETLGRPAEGVRSGEILLLQLKLEVRSVLLVEVRVNLLREFIQLFGPSFEN